MYSLKFLVSKIRHLNRARLQKRKSKRTPLSAIPEEERQEGQKYCHPFFSHVDPKRIRINTERDHPSVSILIVAHGKPEYTLRCLASIAANNPLHSIEIIVIEDHSKDPDAALIREVPGITCMENEENLGHLRSCNKAARHAKGEFILLLNNDTELLPGAIDELVELLETHPQVGLVGSKLLRPDGRLQEAGCIVWKDGTAWNHGRLSDPSLPTYNYTRRVDYVSAASALVRRATWEKLGGYDEHVLPASCADLDLAFRVRQEGYDVIYSPHSMVIHHEGASHGKSTDSGIERHQTLNQEKIKARWASILERDNYPNGQHALKARDRAKHQRVVLLIDHYLPEPDRDAGSRAMMDIIRALLACGYLIKFWPADQVYRKKYAAPLERMGIEILVDPQHASFPGWLAKNSRDIDTFFISRPTVAEKFLPVIKELSCSKVIFFGHDLHFARMALQRKILDDPSLDEKIAAMLRIEKLAWRNSDVVFYPSTEEALKVREMDARIDARKLTPYAVEARSIPRIPPAGKNILFVGGFGHPPNEDAVVWFIEEVFPLVLAHLPDSTVTLAGSHPTPRVQALASRNVTVTGSIPSHRLDELYGTSRLAVVPLRFGAGVKFKTVEAMAQGIPVVTTPIGVQGLDDPPGELQVFSAPDAFSRAIIRLIEDDGFWKEISSVQGSYAARNFSLDSIISQLRHAIEADPGRILREAEANRSLISAGRMRQTPLRDEQPG